MQKVAALTMMLASCWLAAGCTPQFQAPMRALDQSAAIGERTALDSARDWSKKYALLADNHMKLQKATQASADENRGLKGQLSKVQQELSQAKKELADANSMLGELNKELAQWKKDVLGFRQELRRAQKVQISLMSRIVVLLGGEAPEIKIISRGNGVAGNGGTAGG